MSCRRSGLACLFVPINTVAYAFLPPGKNNAASGLINLARNIGGSVGISFVTTMLARRTQYHQSVLSSNLNSGNAAMQARLASSREMLMSHGSTPSQASHQAYQVVANIVDRQATMLAYIDNFKMLSIAVMAMIPFVFLMKRARPGGAARAH